jgi:hypothetical protein
MVKELTLKPQIVFNLIHGQRFDLTPCLVGRLPNDLAIDIRHFKRRADLVGVEVIKLLLCITFVLVEARKQGVVPGS